MLEYISYIGVRSKLRHDAVLGIQTLPLQYSSVAGVLVLNRREFSRGR